MEAPNLDRLCVWLFTLLRCSQQLHFFLFVSEWVLTFFVGVSLDLFCRSNIRTILVVFFLPLFYCCCRVCVERRKLNFFAAFSYPHLLGSLIMRRSSMCETRRAVSVFSSVVTDLYFSADYRFSVTKFGKPLLIHGGYTYSVHSRRNANPRNPEVEHWRCTQRAICCGMMKINRIQKRILIEAKHTHEPNYETIRRREEKAWLKQLATQHTQDAGRDDIGE